MSQLTRRDRFDDPFSDFFRQWARPALFEQPQPGEIKVDVTENEKNYEVRAEVPGAKKEDIKVTVDRNFVSISAEVNRNREEKSNGGRVLLRETYYGSAQRGLSFASEIDAQGVIARLKDGMLSLTLPKKTSSGARTVQID